VMQMHNDDGKVDDAASYGVEEAGVDTVSK
jgi:hypothetical protein